MLTNDSRHSLRSPRIRGQRYNGQEACKIEKNIENFVENFKKKGSSLDCPEMARPPSLESCSSSLSKSSRPSSSIYSSDFTDESPEKTAYLMPEIVKRYRYCSTTSDSDCGEDDFRRLILAYKDSKKHTTDTESSCTEGPDRGPGDGMGTETCPYSVLDVAELLQAKYAYITGAKAKNGAPVITFPDRPNQPEPSEEDYKKIVTYLCSIPDLHETQMGFVLLVDRRQSGWGSVKTILMRFSGYFPCHIQVVFLLQPHGFFQRAFSDYRSKFKEELEYKVVSIDTPSEMYQYIDEDKVTIEVGGQLEFDADEWTQHRSAVEKFSSNTEKISISLNTQLRQFESTCTPNDVEGTEKMIKDHCAQRLVLLEDLESLNIHGQTLLTCIKGDNPRTPLVHVTHVLTVEMLLVQLEETQRHFSSYWNKHHSKLQQGLQLRRFEDEFKTFQFATEKNMDWLEGKMMETGDSVMRVDILTKELDDFQAKAEREIEQGETMRTNGEQYIMDDHYAVDSIRPKCIELQRMCEQYRQLLRRRRDILNKSHDLQERIEKASKWCTKGMDMLANQQLEGCSTTESAGQAIRDIDAFIVTARELKLNNPKEFRQLFDNMITPENRATVQKVLKRFEDVQSMCSKRKSTLQAQVRAQPVHNHVQPDLVTSSSRGQTTVPEYDLKRKDRGHRERRGEPRENPKKAVPPLEKSARLHRVDIGLPQPTPLPQSTHGSTSLPQSTHGSTSLPQSTHGSTSLQQSQSRSTHGSTSLTQSTHGSTSLPQSTHGSTSLQQSQSRSTHGSTSTCSSMSVTDSTDGDPTRHSLASNSTTSGSSSISDQLLENLHEKRKHVLNELIETEQTYVQQLHDILRGYYVEMDNRTMQHLIPDSLLEQKDVLFGNLDQIYRFHHDVFLKDLQSCEDCPSKLGKCFVNRMDEFQMYSIYCQNKPRSEELRNETGDNNPFFKECQRKLGHKLPLGAYLLKPVQRITKYQLLLKEMLKYTKDDKTCQQHLEESLNAMLEVVRIVNNSMYQVAIVGFTGNLSDLGKLLMQGSFNVWTDHKREKIRDIRFKPMHRHLFLYEKAILLCKRKEDVHNGDRDAFCFKNMLRCNQVGLTENIKGDKKKLELWLRGREEVYIVQAPSLEVKEFWVKEIKKVLMGQFDEMRCNVNKLNLVQRSSEDLTISGSDSGMGSWRHRQGSGNNNTSTIPVGITMMSPESPPDDNMNNEHWSDGEFTDSDPEGEKRHKTHVSPLEQYVAIADYRPVDDVEMGLVEGDVLEILRTGSTGWWLAHHLTTNEEGWVPSTYLDPVSKAGSMSYDVSVSSLGSASSQADQTSRSSATSGYSANSPVDETTI